MPAQKPKSKMRFIFIGCGGCLTIFVLLFVYSFISGALIRRSLKNRTSPNVKIYDKETLSTMPRPETVVSYSKYPVYGTTQRDVDSSILENFPKYEGEIYRAQDVQGEEAGRVEANIYWGMTPVQNTDECAMADVKLDTKITFVMPDWKDRNKATSSVTTEWDRFYNALELHENGHKDFELQHIDEIWEVLKNAPKFEKCDDLDKYLKTQVGKVNDKNGERNMNYDSQTQHGQNQGANTTTTLSETQAIEKVKNLPDVIDYLKRVPSGIVEVDNELDGEYNVHVYEVKDGHTATFNWYRVNTTTGAIVSDF